MSSLRVIFGGTNAFITCTSMNTRARAMNQRVFLCNLYYPVNIDLPVFSLGKHLAPSSACASPVTGQTIVYYPTSSPLAKCPPANEAYTASNNAFRTRSAVRSDNRSISLRVTRRYIDNHADGRLTAPSKETREKLIRDVICEQTTFFSRCLRLSPGKERSTQRRKELGYQVY